MRRAYLGIAGGPRPVPPQARAATGVDTCVEVVEVVEGSPADRAGIRPEDLILTVNGTRTERVEDLQRLMVAELIGTPVEVRLLRAGRLIELELDPAELRGDERRAPDAVRVGRRQPRRSSASPRPSMRRAPSATVLEPVFRGMDERHPQHVAVWLGEVFGGPPLYTEEHGGYPHMVAKHRDRALTEQAAPPLGRADMRRGRRGGAAGRPRVPLGVRGLHRVGHAAARSQLAAGERSRPRRPCRAGAGARRPRG